MERGFSTLLATLALTLAVSSCIVSAQNDTTTQAPSPSEPVGKDTFVLHDGNKVCLRMTVAIVVNITYNNTDGKNVSVSYPLTNHAEVNASSVCNREKPMALVYVVPKIDEFGFPDYYVLFNFTGSTKSGDQHWAWGNISFGVDTYILDDLKGGDQGLFEYTTDAALHGDANSRVELERSYTCDTNQVLLFTPKEKKEEKKEETPEIVAFVYVSQLQVQAFRFRNDTTGYFDNARTCLLDSSGKANKIVPIAVGAALAGLVIVVLIAYLIGRLRSRRQSSYEALS